jgi:cell division protein FtsL
VRRIDLPRGPLARAVLIAAPVVGAALFYVWAQLTTVLLGYRISEAAEQLQSLREQNRSLRLEAASLRSPERLERIAVQFGLAPPVRSQVVEIQGAAP